MSDAGQGGTGTGQSGAGGTTQGTSQGATGATTNAGATSDWTTGLNDELKGFVQTKGFKDPSSVLDSYRNLEKSFGVPAERLLRLPEQIDLAKPEGRAIFERLGMPKEAKDYNLTLPKEITDAKVGEKFKEIGHKHALTGKQLEGVVSDILQWEMGDQTAKIEASKLELAKQENELKTEWGAAFDQNKNIAASGVKAMGFSKEEVGIIEDAIGFSRTMKLLHKLGSATGEHEFHGGKGQSASGVMTPSQAQAKINELSRDKTFYSRLKAGDIDAKKQWDNLNSQAAARPS